MNSCNYTILHWDCYINTIVDMQNEKKFFGHCNEFEYNHDLVFVVVSVVVIIIRMNFT